MIEKERERRVSPLHPITYATDRATGIVDPPLLFFALVPDDRSLPRGAARLLRREASEGGGGGEKRAPCGETAVYSGPDQA